MLQFLHHQLDSGAKQLDESLDLHSPNSWPKRRWDARQQFIFLHPLATFRRKNAIYDIGPVK
jgi:hypothetical protein